MYKLATLVLTKLPRLGTLAISMSSLSMRISSTNAEIHLILFVFHLSAIPTDLS